MRRALIAVLLAASGIALAGCQTSDNTLQPVSATAVPKTETFSGTVPAGGLDFRNFVVEISGNAAITLTSLTNSTSNTVIGELGVGTPSTTTCALLTGAVA